MTKRLFIAGASGAVGKCLVRLCEERGTPFVAHSRPKPGRSSSSRDLVCELSDASLMVPALKECTTVVQLIGTMRNRFTSGDTYETSDIGTTQVLVTMANAARLEPGNQPTHFILLSSMGAGLPLGAYLKAKARAESIVQTSAIPCSIVRPSAFDGEGRHAPAGLGIVRAIPLLNHFAPIATDDVARAIHALAMAGAEGQRMVEGRAVFDLARAH